MGSISDLFWQLYNDGRVLWLFAAVIIWPLLALITRYSLLVLLGRYHLERWSEFPRVLLRPFLFFLITMLLMFSFLRFEDPVRQIWGSGSFQDSTVVVLLAVLRILSGVWLWLCAKPVLMIVQREFVARRYREYGKEKERNIAESFHRLSYLVVGLLILSFVAWLFRLNLAAYLVGLGALGLGLGFGLQRLVENILAGMSLSVDAPFSRNDLIKIGNEKNLYQVINRGIRVTTVKDVESHEIVYLPNRKLAEEPLIDVTRPTDDLRCVIEVGVPYHADLRVVRDILLNIAYGHPHIVAAYEDKKTAIREKVYRLYIRGGFVVRGGEQVFQECKDHFIELARLKCEDDLNDEILSLKQRLENWAWFVDWAEEYGFQREEKTWLHAISEELLNRVSNIVNLTTQWQILLRNCTARAKKIRFQLRRRSGKDFEDSYYLPLDAKFAKEISSQILEDPEVSSYLGDDFGNKDEKKPGQHITSSDLTSSAREEQEETWPVSKRLQFLAAALGKLNSTLWTEKLEGDFFENDSAMLCFSYAPANLDNFKKVYESLTGRPTTETDRLSQSEREKLGFIYANSNLKRVDVSIPEGFKSEMSPVLAAMLVLSMIETAKELSDKATIPPETPATSPGYVAAKEEAQQIAAAYNGLGDAYISLMRTFVEHIVEREELPHPQLRTAHVEELGRSTGFSIALCRTRGESLYLSDLAIQYVLDHPLCEAVAGQITDDDQRNDLAEVMRVWGDKTTQLIEKANSLQGLMRQARSTTIDTELRELAEWLKDKFKDPFPQWKYPIAPVQGFGDSAINLAVKFYIDNVRMEKYMRMGNTFTAFRLRIVERLANEGIPIPFPQRDIHIKTGSLPNEAGIKTDRD